MSCDMSHGEGRVGGRVVFGVRVKVNLDNKFLSGPMQKMQTQ